MQDVAGPMLFYVLRLTGIGTHGNPSLSITLGSSKSLTYKQKARSPARQEEGHTCGASGIVDGELAGVGLALQQLDIPEVLRLNTPTQCG